MSKVLFAWISAFLMVAVGCAVLVDAADDSAATCPSSCHCLDPADVTVTGSVNVYYYVNNQWDAVNVAAYDLKQAVDAASNTLGYTLTYATGAAVWTDGTNPSLNYGEIAAVNNSATFTVFVYDNTASEWNIAQTAIGWYRPFADYAATEFPDGSSAGAANIAIVPAAVSTIPAGTATELAMIGLTQITPTAEYRYCFHLKVDVDNIVVPDDYEVIVYNDSTSSFVTDVLTADDLKDGIVVYGYGSDGYQALKNALPGQVVGQEVTFELHTNPNNTTYYTFYSWMDTVFGVGTVSEFGENFSKYTYWASYTCEGNSYLSYTFGYYSKLVGRDLPACGFTYHYEVSLYTW